MIAQFICDNSGANAVDDGTIDTLLSNFKLSIQAVTRTKVTSPTLNFFVAKTGSDANNGLNTTTPKLTIGAALIAAYSLFDYNGHALTVNVAAGTYNEAVSFDGLPLGCTQITLVGNNAAPGGIIISVTNANAVTISNSQVNVQGLTMQASGGGNSGNGLLVNSSTVTYQNIVFGACGNVQLFAGALADVTATGPVTFQGASAYGVASESASSVFLNGVAITFSGGTSYSQAWALTSQSGSLNVVGSSFNGTFTGVRYVANFCSTISVNGAGLNYFPGSANGVTSTNAVYQ